MDEEKQDKDVPEGNKILYFLKICFLPQSPGTDNKAVLVKELVIFTIYITTLSVVIYSSVSPYQYYYSTSIQTLFIDGPNLDQTWTDVSDWDNLWKYLEETFLSGVFDSGGKGNNGDTIFVYLENELISVPRLRQLRVRNETCTIPTVFSANLQDCYGRFSDDNQDTSNIEYESVHSVDTSNAGTYENVDAFTFDGNIASYGSGGFVQLLVRNKQQSALILQDLKYNTWISQSSRVLFIDFSLYNANINMFCIVKLVAEFLPTGGVTTSYNFQVDL